MAETSTDLQLDAHEAVGTQPDLRVMLDAQRQTCPVVRAPDGTVTLLSHADVRAAPVRSPLTGHCPTAWTARSTAPTGGSSTPT